MYIGILSELVQSLKTSDLVHYSHYPERDSDLSIVSSYGHSSIVAGNSSSASHQVFILLIPTAFLCIFLFKFEAREWVYSPDVQSWIP